MPILGSEFQEESGARVNVEEPGHSRAAGAQPKAQLRGVTLLGFQNHIFLWFPHLNVE